MPLHIYNSLARKKEEFIPSHPPQITMYVCGPTVYDDPHIGHARSAYLFDVIRKYLEYRGKDKGWQVRFVRNVTDVDDKIIEKARKERTGEDLNVAVKSVSEKYLNAYHEALNDLHIGADNRPLIEPKASEYIGQMIVFIQDLINKGRAYAAGGDVYFDITTAKEYGKLSHQSLDKMESGARVAPTEHKKNPLDFALWKSVKENEPCWESPWGKGRPGWHIECSAMSSDLLGDEFDIHGGGIDLIFPHHENEIAQSEGAGKKFARVWIHHGLLTINSQKMSKSLGNFVTVKEVVGRYPADILKILYLQANYGSPIDFSWDKMEGIKKAYEHITILAAKLEDILGSRRAAGKGQAPAGEMGKFRDQFIEYMDDDFNTPRALSVLFDIVHECNRLISSDEKSKNSILQNALEIIDEIAGVLGLTFLSDATAGAPVSSPAGSAAGAVSDETIRVQISSRAELKKQKKYKEADDIRKSLEAQGIILEDTRDGNTTWRRKI